MGFCTIAIRRTTSPLLVAALVACEQSAPATFDPEDAALDVAALEAVFETPLMQSLVFAGAEIDRATGGVEADLAAASSGGFAGRLIQSMSGPARPDFSAGELPAAIAGRTYVFDAASDAYVVSESTGAPPAGVRFQLYAIDPASGGPVAPLSGIGHVDLISEASSRMLIRVADEAGVRLEYHVTSSGSEAEARVQVEGFSTSGGARADFNFDSRIEVTGFSSGVMRLRETLDLASRSVEWDCASVLLVRSQLPPEFQLDLLHRSPAGEIGVAGGYELGGNGSLAVRVNGDSYAAVNLVGSDYAVAGAGGAPLPASSMELLDRVIASRDCGLDRFDRLVRPVETLIAP